jgi:hypothetical protein
MLMRLNDRPPPDALSLPGGRRGLALGQAVIWAMQVKDRRQPCYEIARDWISLQRPNTGQCLVLEPGAAAETQSNILRFAAPCRWPRSASDFGTANRA